MRKAVSAGIIRLERATLRRGKRTLWTDLDLSVSPGEFITVLGPNGSGKTSLLKVLLGLLPLSQGTVDILGRPVSRGNDRIGYILQQKGFDADVPIRGRDLVQLGATGNRYGFSPTGSLEERRVDEAIEAVNASEYAGAPLGQLSGGQQQRLRVAQALVGKPDILLCDEPLLSLDVASQRAVTKLIDTYRREHQACVIFVTHEINPVLQYTDRILYLANGRWAVDRPDAVLRPDTLSKLYGTAIDVVRTKNRVLVLDTDDTAAGGHHGGES
jgi:zinc/manganese transport system ATP-binding protein